MKVIKLFADRKQEESPATSEDKILEENTHHPIIYRREQVYVVISLSLKCAEKHTFPQHGSVYIPLSRIEDESVISLIQATGLNINDNDFFQVMPDGLGLADINLIHLDGTDMWIRFDPEKLLAVIISENDEDAFAALSELFRDFRERADSLRMTLFEKALEIARDNIDKASSDDWQNTSEEYPVPCAIRIDLLGTDPLSPLAKVDRFTLHPWLPKDFLDHARKIRERKLAELAKSKNSDSNET